MNSTLFLGLALLALLDMLAIVGCLKIKLNLTNQRAIHARYRLKRLRILVENL